MISVACGIGRRLLTKCFEDRMILRRSGVVSVYISSQFKPYKNISGFKRTDLHGEKCEEEPGSVTAEEL